MDVKIFKQNFEDILIESLKKSFDILRSVVSHDSELRNDILLQNQRFETNEKHYTSYKLDDDKYSVNLARVFTGVKDIIDQISENDLISQWNELDTIKDNFLKEEELIDEEEISDISIQELIQKGVDSIILTETKGLKKETIVELETLILNCQDALGVEKYDEAEQYCLEAKKLDFKSPQIYEYLAFIYFKRKSSNEIIEEVINGKGTTFKHIIQFTKRFHQFKSRYKPTFDVLGDENIKHIGQILTKSIYRKYRKLQKGDKDAIWNCIQAYKQIFDNMLSPLGFIEMALVELSGGGKISWLNINNEKPNNKWFNYNALQLRKDFLEKLANFFKLKDENLSVEEAQTMAQKRIRNSFFNQIRKDYNRVRQERNTKGQYRWTDDHRKEVKRFLNSSKLGFYLFEDENFLNKPFEELTHRGKRFMPWLDLSRNGNLVNFFKAKDIKYDSLHELKFFAEKLNLDFDQVKIEMHEKLFQKLEDKARKKYAYAKERSTNPKPNIGRIRENIIDCLKSCLLLQKKQNTTGEDYLILGVTELTGSGILDDWITINPDGSIESNAEALKLKFNAEKYLKDFLRNKPAQLEGEKVKEVDEVFFEELFINSLATYNSISVHAPFDDDWEDERKQIVSCIESFELCFLANPQKKYIEVILDELHDNGKLYWISEDNEGDFNLSACNDINFNAISFRDRNLNRMKKIDPNYTTKKKTKAKKFTDAILGMFGKTVSANP